MAEQDRELNIPDDQEPMLPGNAKTPDRENGKPGPRSRSLSSLEARVRAETSHFNFGTLVSGAGAEESGEAVVATDLIGTVLEQGASCAQPEETLGSGSGQPPAAGQASVLTTYAVSTQTAPTPGPVPRLPRERLRIEQHAVSPDVPDARSPLWFLVGVVVTGLIGIVLIMGPWRAQAGHGNAQSSTRVAPQVTERPAAPSASVNAGVSVPTAPSVKTSAPVANQPVVSQPSQAAERPSKTVKQAEQEPPRTVASAGKQEKAAQPRTAERSVHSRTATTRSTTKPAAHSVSHDSDFDRGVNKLVNQIP